MQLLCIINTRACVNSYYKMLELGAYGAKNKKSVSRITVLYIFRANRGPFYTRTLPLGLSVTDITQLQIFFRPGNERRLKNQLVQLQPRPHTIIMLLIEDRVHCWLKPPYKRMQTTLTCSLHPYTPAVTILGLFFFFFLSVQSLDESFFKAKPQRL